MRYLILATVAASVLIGQASVMLTQRLTLAPNAAHKPIVRKIKAVPIEKRIAKLEKTVARLDTRMESRIDARIALRSSLAGR